MKYRKKPVVIEARPWNGTEDSRHDLNIWLGDKLCWSSDGSPCIFTLEGLMRAEDGDWIIKGVKGEFYPIKNDIFQQTYEAVDATQEP